MFPNGGWRERISSPRSWGVRAWFVLLKPITALLSIRHLYFACLASLPPVFCSDESLGRFSQKWVSVGPSNSPRNFNICFWLHLLDHFVQSPFSTGGSWTQHQIKESSQNGLYWRGPEIAIPPTKKQTTTTPTTPLILRVCKNNFSVHRRSDSSTLLLTLIQDVS